MRKCFLWLLFGTWTIMGWSQAKYAFSVKWTDEPPESLLKAEDFQPTTLADSAAVIAHVEALLLTLRNAGHLTASVDDVVRTLVRGDENVRTKVRATLYAGPKYRWRELRPGNVPEAFLQQIRFRERAYQNRLVRESDIRDVQERLLTYAENHGYPFVNLRLDSLEIDSTGGVAAALHVDTGPLYLFDELNLTGNADISPVYLKSYLGIRPDQPFDRRAVLRIRQRIKELPFLEENRGVTITFRENRAILNLSLKRRKASRFDLLFGFLPNASGVVPPSGGGGNQGFQFTATGKADWQNQFGRGERIYVEYERVRPRTQELDLLFSYPYVLDLPFGLEGTFDLFKNDTFFLEVQYDAGVQYLFGGGNYLKAFVEQSNTNLLSFRPASVTNGTLPENVDLNTSLFGLEWNWSAVDYRFNPRRGWRAVLRGGAGFKTIEENPQLLELNENIYEDVTLRTFQYRFRADGAVFLPLGGSGTLQTRLRGGYLLAPETPVYRNEQYRIGGNQLLRGFDEESIFATQYAVLTVEPRLIFSQNGYFFAFADVAYYRDFTDRTDRDEQPIGVGAGLALETPAGILGVTLAVGKTRAEAFNFRAPKIHIGYVSLF